MPRRGELPKPEGMAITREMKAVRDAELLNLAIKQFQATITRRFEQATFRLASEAYHSALYEVWTTPMKTAADNKIFHESEIMEAQRAPFEGLKRIPPQVVRDTPAELLDSVILNGKGFAIVSNPQDPYGTGQTTKYHAVLIPAEEYRRLLIDRERLSRLAGELVAISNGKS